MTTRYSEAYQQPGDSIPLTAPYARAGGEGAQVGAIFGVARAGVANGVEGEFATEGVFTLAKTSAQAWAQGDRIFWDNVNKRCDNVPTVGMLIGTALAAAANPSPTGIVVLNEAAPELLTGAQAAEAAVATADATDLASAEALANALKVTVNSLITKLHAAGILA